MLILLIKLIIYRIYRILGFPRLLPINYTISVTNKCNSRCQTCFIYNVKSEQMNVSEYKKIFKKIGKAPYWVTISGGEPFLRKDLVDIVIALDKYCRPRIINIPTNGILTPRILYMVRQICKSLPRTQIIINLSIDGIDEEHDRIRNVKGNFNRVINTFKALKKLKYKNLIVGIHTVISKYNVENFPVIASYLMQLAPDSYITEIAEERHELANIGKDITPSALEYRAAIDFLLHRIKNNKFKGMSRITQSFRIEYYNLVKKILRDKKQVIPCYAGIASCHIAPNGDVWMCCTKAKPIGNLRKKDYNFSSIWFSKNAKIERKEIRQKRCYCPLANSSYTNLLLNIPSLWRVFIRSYIKW
ncbi:MAG: radical SAM protein [Candidatus Cloacimonetes bacterium]|nr:radical SAM protein [Candidatus Cloacimonadota bacterium]